jgi:alcohol dehydrogenase class IV
MADAFGHIRFGRGQAAQAAGLIRGFGASVLLVHGSDSARADWLAQDLAGQGVDVTRLPCAAEPTDQSVHNSLDLCRAQRPDAIVSLGGGSVIDLGKALAALAPGGALLDHVEGVGKGQPLLHDPLPFVAIPTTAGTGAEATKNAVIAIPDTQGMVRKVSLRDPRMVPDLAIVDPALMQGAPKSVVLAAGLDAVTQVIEPYVSNRATAFTDMLCQAAIPVGLRALRDLMDHDMSESWDAMAATSLIGGISLARAGLGAVHGFAGVIGGMCSAPHGAVCGTLLPHVLAANRAVASGDTKARLEWVQHQIETVFGPGPDALQNWSAGHGLPTLAQMGVRADQHDQIALLSQSASSMKSNPYTLPLDDLRSILRAAS